MMAQCGRALCLGVTTLYCVRRTHANGDHYYYVGDEVTRVEWRARALVLESREPSAQVRRVCWCGEWRDHDHAPPPPLARNDPGRGID
jgi:hypothetical protein